MGFNKFNNKQEKQNTTHVLSTKDTQCPTWKISFARMEVDFGCFHECMCYLEFWNRFINIGFFMNLEVVSNLYQ